MPTKDEWERKLLETFELKPNHMVEPALLEAMGVPADETDTIYQALKGKRVKTWGDLESLKSEEAVQKFAGDALRGTRIWDEVQKYKKYSEANKSAQMRSKVLVNETRQGVPLQPQLDPVYFVNSNTSDNSLKRILKVALEPPSDPFADIWARQKVLVLTSTVEISPALDTKLNTLFYHGVDLETFEQLPRKPMFHQKSSSSNSMSFPITRVDGSEGGDRIFVHDIHTRRLSKDAPDIAVTVEVPKSTPVIAQTSNFVVEIKAKDGFGTDEHLKQALRYAYRICKGFGYTHAFVVLAAHSKVQMMELRREENDLSLYLSPVFDLTITQSLGSGYLMLSKFIEHAMPFMTVQNLPKLINIKNGTAYELKRVEMLQIKRTSNLFINYDEDDSTTVLKKVIDKLSFQRELEALKAIAKSAVSTNVQRLLAVDENTHHLLSTPLGKTCLTTEVIAEICTAWPFDKVSKMFRDLEDAIKSIHILKFIHRDIRPENIVFCESSGQDAGKFVLIDFGLAVKGPEFHDFTYEFFAMFASEQNLETKIKELEVGNLRDQTYTWTYETDLKAFHLVVQYLLSYPVIARKIREKYQPVLNRYNDVNGWASFLECRKRLCPEASPTSLDAVFKRILPSPD